MANQFTKGKQRGHKKETRERIQAAKLVNRLHECVMGRVELNPQQVAAAKALLAKVLPDLQSVAMTGEIKQTYAVGDTPQMTKDEWAKQFSDSLH